MIYLDKTSDKTETHTFSWPTPSLVIICFISTDKLLIFLSKIYNSHESAPCYPMTVLKS